MARRFHQWAASTSVPNEPQDAYDLYLEAYEQEARRDFDAGGHEYATFEEYLADDPPMPWPDFFAEWYREQEAQARELGWRSA